ncbi:uncharacterized protein LOC123320886 [Coccinella septempunctata]|uniref:uncharacterized protein LOC123320886 n=1 Tax=Coccinella septempunctata TaxID=41139 RepID=UPI001D05D322|nr:uncharacterized protein LOC123320886 [Coccinella septempunctata]
MDSDDLDDHRYYVMALMEAERRRTPRRRRNSPGNNPGNDPRSTIQMMLSFLLYIFINIYFKKEDVDFSEFFYYIIAPFFLGFLITKRNVFMIRLTILYGIYLLLSYLYLETTEE